MFSRNTFNQIKNRMVELVSLLLRHLHCSDNDNYDHHLKNASKI